MKMWYNPLQISTVFGARLHDNYCIIKLKNNFVNRKKWQLILKHKVLIHQYLFIYLYKFNSLQLVYFKMK